MSTGQTKGISENQEYEFKAVYLYHFLRFIEWPEDDGNATPLVIGILGTDPFDTALDDVLRNENINGRAVVAARYNRLEDIRNCHLLFIAKDSGVKLEQVLKAIPPGTVTVGETPGFARRGGAINFYVDRDRLLFEVNEEALARADVKVSSQLLRLSRLVAEKETGRE